MNTTRYAYVCQECAHCRILSRRTERVQMMCALCGVSQTFLLCSVVTDHGEYEEWERI